MNRRVIECLLGLVALNTSAFGQGYTPDTLELNGNDGLDFDPVPQLQIADGGTIEFWVAPAWSADPGYDPVIICNAGPEGASFLIAMLRDRDGIAIAAGGEEDIATFDFTDGQFHHVAVSQFEDGTAVFVDGQLTGTSEFRFQDLPSVGVWIGSIDGMNNRFVGAIGGMRVWNTVIEQETLVEYALKDIFTGNHPDLLYLSALSEFANRDLLLVEPADAPSAQ